jgi:predicted glycoside hydrolase/deacetylase ChbG (UPF0249 family)
VSKLAQALGVSALTKVAVIHVDDLGMCHAANVGGFAAIESGPATCGSIMVPCPAFEEAAARAKGNPRLDVGVHLTLNAEWAEHRWGPVAGAKRVPSLVDAKGCFWASDVDVVQHATVEDVAVELRAQVEKALKAGIDVTHLDSHMGTLFLRPDFIGAYLEVAREFSIPPFVAFPTAELAAAIGADFESLRGVAEALEADGVPVFDFFEGDSLSFARGGGEAHARTRIGRLPPGLSYLTCHASAGLPELFEITPDAHCRAFEAGFWGGAKGRAALSEAGVQTVGMRPIAELWKRDLARS